MYAKRLAILGLGMAVSLGGCVTSRVVHRTGGDRHAGTKVVLLRDRVAPRLIKEPDEKRHRDTKPPMHKVENKRSQPERSNEPIRPIKPQIHKGSKPQSRKEQGEPRKGKPGEDKGTKVRSREESREAEKGKDTKQAKKDTNPQRREAEQQKNRKEETSRHR